MRSRLFLFLVLALALQARGEYVSLQQARNAAVGWTRSGKVLGRSVDPTVSRARTIAVTNDVVVHAVTMKDGSTVFVSGDFAFEPIVAFCSSSPSDESPLVDILRRDAYLRAAQAASRSAAKSASSGTRTRLLSASASTASSAGSDDAIARKWDALISEGSSASSSSRTRLLSAAAKSYTEEEAETVLTDIRVAPLLETKWSQTTVDDSDFADACYNYYTPPYDAGSSFNYPCGCTATALAQMMYYYKYPAALPDASFRAYSCRVDGETTALWPLFDEDEEGNITQRAYAWNVMVATPGLGTSAEACAAIGHLTYDAGVLLHSDYAYGSTGASPPDIGNAVHAFGYPQGYVYCNEDGLEEYYFDHELPTSSRTLTGSEDLRRRTILASLDAKIPTFLGIYGFRKQNGQITNGWAGHAVVADGYAMLEVDGEETTYVHVNLGWSGQDNAWYNIPEIDTASVGATMDDESGVDFQLLSAASFNISPDESNVGMELVTGRVLDDDGVACEGAVVTALTDGGVAAATATTDDKGVYALWLPGGVQYDIEATAADGQLVGSSGDMVTPGVTEAYANYIVDTPAAVGNIWGVDIEVGLPCVRIGEASFASLDRALASAVDGDVIEVVLPARFRAPFTVTNDISIVATNADAYASAVSCRSSAILSVTNGASVAFSNIVFESSGTVVNVLSGGKARVSGVTVFDDLCSGVPGIVTADGEGFVLAGELLSGITLSCATAPDAGDQFGVYTCDADVAKGCAKRIISLDGDGRAGTWGGDAFLVWEDGAEIDPAVALVSLDVDGDVTYYRHLDGLFDVGHSTNGTVVATLLRTSASLTNSWQIAAPNASASWTFRSDKGGTVAFGGNASLTFGADVSFVCSNITLAGSQMSSASLFTVSSNAVFTLASDVCVSGFPYASGKHVVEVQRAGRFVMEEGSSILGCAMGTGSGSGTVYLAGGSEFDFTGGEISGCSAQYNGGAVYVANGATLNVSGSATAYGNTCGGATNDVYLAAKSTFALAGALDGSGGIGIRGAGTVINEGNVFGEIADEISDDDLLVAQHTIHNEANDALYAAVAGSDLVWSTQRPFPLSVELADAVAMVTDSSGDVYYGTIEDAFRAVVEEGSTITLLDDVVLTESVPVLYDELVLDGRGYYVYRASKCAAFIAVTNMSFTTKDVVFEGGCNRIIDAFEADVSLESGTGIQTIEGSSDDFVAPVVVWGGTFSMTSGVWIADCVNSCAKSVSKLAAGAVLVNGSSSGATAYLYGGTVTGCSSAQAGGILIANEAGVEIQGDLDIRGNKTTSGTRCNLFVNDLSTLTLVGEFTGAVGYTEGVNAPTNTFGVVADGLTTEVATNGAALFFHDSDKAGGLVDSDGVTLVWGEAGSYSGETGDDPVIVEPEPIAFKSIMQTETGWELVITNRVPYCWYRLIWTDDLSTGFSVTGDWEQATSSGEWTTNIVTTTDAFFWKAEAKEGEVTE